MFKPVHYLTYAAFLTALANNTIPADSLVFIKDKSMLYTHGGYYYCNFSAEDITALNNLIDAVLNHIDDTDIHVTTIDNTPTLNSTNTVTSGGVYDALSNKLNRNDYFTESSFGVTIGSSGNKDTFFLPWNTLGMSGRAYIKYKDYSTNNDKYEYIATERDVKKIEPLILEGDEYYVKKSNNIILPLSPPDLSTQPSILPQRFGKYYLYEVLIPVSQLDEALLSDIEVTKRDYKYLTIKEGNLILPGSTIIESSIFGENILDSPTIIQEETQYEKYSKIPLTFEILSSGTITITNVGDSEDLIVFYLVFDKNLNLKSLEEIEISIGDTYTLLLNSLNIFEVGDTISFLSEYSPYHRIRFGGTANIKAFGNIFSLITPYASSNGVYGENYTEQWTAMSMFENHTSLIDAKDLILLPKGALLLMEAYYEMFSSCSNLELTPEYLYNWNDQPIPSHCYSSMFSNCVKITRSPIILSTEFEYRDSASNMFEGCSNLNYVICYFKDTKDGPISQWLKNTANNGVIECLPDISFDISDIPSNWILSPRLKEKDRSLKAKTWNIYPRFPGEDFSKLNYFLVRYYNEYYPNYY